MDDDAFAAYVLNNSPRYELETLEKIVRGLENNIAGRRWGKPPDLQIGSNVEATQFGSSWRRHGTVIALRPKGCVIEPHDSKYTFRISYSKYAVRVLDEFEWNRICYWMDARRKEFDERLAAEIRERVEDREAAVSEREENALQPVTMQALDGPVQLYRGAFVHAYNPNDDSHEYGVVVRMTPKKIVLTSNESDWGSSVWVGKHEVEVLDEERWAVVDAEQRRRKAEYEAAKQAGREDRLPDYCRVAIAVPQTMRLKT